MTRSEVLAKLERESELTEKNSMDNDTDYAMGYLSALDTAINYIKRMKSLD